jgi:hypothetical protein
MRVSKWIIAAVFTFYFCSASNVSGHEGHRFVNTDHQRDRIRCAVAWFDPHLR